MVIEVYEGITKPGADQYQALDPNRPQSLESEAREMELVAQRNAALSIGLAAVAGRCDDELARLRCARAVPYPLLSAEEVRVWQAFLPTRYTDGVAMVSQASALAVFGGSPSNSGIRRIKDYLFDTPPLSVMETWAQVQASKVFDALEVWTPERQRVDPILVGYKTFDKRSIGPFLIARWGEALKAFDEIKAEVEKMTLRPDSQLQRALFQRAQAVPSHALGQQWTPLAGLMGLF